MKSIVSYNERGHWGKSEYRGNCTGFLIKELLELYRPKKFIEVFSGGGTGKDVARELGIVNSLHLDLNTGWNALKDEIPGGNDFTFSHPPYWDIIRYEQMRGAFDPDDLSNVMSYDDFIEKLDRVNMKIYNSLTNGGRHAFLVGDVRKKGKYYSIIKDMTWFGDLESHVIKEQFNTFSERKSYKGDFIPIVHEHLLVFKKNGVWQLGIKYTKDFVKELRELNNVTWKDLVLACVETLKENATLRQIYSLLENCSKGKNNNHVQEKIRQTLYSYDCFVKRGSCWTISFE